MYLTARPVLARIFAIDRALRAETWPNARTLGRELEVNPRTILRDLDYLRDQLHAPIEFNPKKNGFRYSEPSYRLPFLQLTEGELVALFLSEQLLRQYRGTPYGPDLARVFAKIAAGLNAPITVDANRLSEAISFRTPAVVVFDVTIIKTLLDAILRRRRIIIDYWTASSDRESRREVDPYHLTSCDGQYYLIAYCHKRREIREFVPARIRAMEVTETEFVIPETFRVEEYFSGALGVFGNDDESRHHVRLRFTGLAVRYIRERQWHPSQTLETTPQGDEIVMTLEVSHFREVERFVLSWLPHCEILEPPELRESIIRSISEAARMHTPSK
jgi:predicted DNA-binding transcriptional regulator YafY